MDLAWSVEVVDGVSLVAVTVASDLPIARRVRVRNRLDGPVLPPRRRGVPEAGWDEEGVTRAVPPAGTLAVGYACPAPPVDPPVELSAADADEARPEPGETNRPVRRAIRTLPPARPPGSVVPVTTPSGREVAEDADVADPETVPSTESVEELPTTDVAAIERRVSVAERLDGASVPEATAVLVAAGGLDAVAELPAELAADAEALADADDDPPGLRERLADAAVPVEALRRLA